MVLTTHWSPRGRVAAASFHTVIWLSLQHAMLLFGGIGVRACSIWIPPRYGSFILEDTIRITSDPNKVVARMGYFQQSNENFREPATLEMITIDVNTGEMAWGYPGDISVTIYGPMGGHANHRNPDGFYNIQVNADSTATLMGGRYVDMNEFTFDYTGPVPNEDGDFDGFQPTYFRSWDLDLIYFFYNEKVGDALDGSFWGNGDPVVTIIDISDTSAITYKSVKYEGQPGYFNGPVLSVWDGFQVVELPESGADCFNSVYLHYDRDGVYFLDYNAWTDDSFTMNAIATEQSNGSRTMYAYNIKNEITTTNPDNFEDAKQISTGYVLEKLNIATGEKTELMLRNFTTTSDVDESSTVSDSKTFESTSTTVTLAGDTPDEPSPVVSDTETSESTSNTVTATSKAATSDTTSSTTSIAMTLGAVWLPVLSAFCVIV